MMGHKKNNPLKTVLIITIGFSSVFVLFNYNWALYTAIITGILGVSSDKLAGFINTLWMKLVKILSLVIPNILLGLIFYLVLFPISLLSKTVGTKSTLQLKNTKDSYWLDNEEIDALSFEKMW